MSKHACLNILGFWVVYVAMCAACSLQVSATERVTVIENSIGMKLALIPSGTFGMGAEEGAKIIQEKYPYAPLEAIEDEYPRKAIQISRAFYMGQHEVTVAQFRRFCKEAIYTPECRREDIAGTGIDKEGGTTQSKEFGPFTPIGWTQKDDHPVTFVTWNDAIHFCQWLSEKEGKVYNLPTEAEWEYCCRAGSKDAFSFGKDQSTLVQYANVSAEAYRKRYPDEKMGLDDASGDVLPTSVPFPYVPGSDGYVYVSPVGSFKPNAFGLFDMHGNAAEWCSDWYASDAYIRTSFRDPKGPAVKSDEAIAKCVRGGSFFAPAFNTRCACRTGCVPLRVDCTLGFRVMCEK